MSSRDNSKLREIVERLVGVQLGPTDATDFARRPRGADSGHRAQGEE